VQQKPFVRGAGGGHVHLARVGGGEALRCSLLVGDAPAGIYPLSSSLGNTLRGGPLRDSPALTRDIFCDVQQNESSFIIQRALCAVNGYLAFLIPGNDSCAGPEAGCGIGVVARTANSLCLPPPPRASDSRHFLRRATKIRASLSFTKPCAS
jgi:hypothetical protein